MDTAVSESLQRYFSLQVETISSKAQWNKNDELIGNGHDLEFEIV